MRSTRDTVDPHTLLPMLGIDPSWKSLGWALAGPAGPYAVGVIRCARRHRWQALAADLLQLVPHRDRAGRVAVEVPGRHGAVHGKEVETVRGVSLIAGAVLLWGAACPDAPWELEPTAWRAWWGIGGGDRAELKAKAVRLVEREGWGVYLPQIGGDDAAEAILIAVGAARNWAIAP